jgi:cytidylate kinase
VALEFRPKLSVGPEDDDGVVGFLNQQALDETWLRTPLCTKYLSLVAAFPDVRAVLAPAIRAFVEKYCERDGQTMVTAGRDCGTDLWPQASFKFYIEAPLEVRSARREQQFAQGADDLAARDQADSTRTVAPLRKAPDAVTLDSGKFSPEELCEQAVFNIRQRLEWRTGIPLEDTGVGI